MNDNNNKRRKSKLPDVTSFSSPDAAGWLFRMIHDGWLSRKFKKRYCVLSGGMLYFYEFQDSNGSEKACGSIDLKLYAKCVEAAKKETKKYSTAFALEAKEPTAAAVGSKTNKSQKKMHRELFYAENEDNKIKWMSKLNEAISLCVEGGGGKKLEHVTKTRAKPPGGSGGGKRRPPTKNHLKERAKMAEVSLGVEIEPKSPKQKRGKQPTSAIKPPPLRKTTDASQTSSVDLPPPPPHPEDTLEEPLPSPPPPPPPLKDLKPIFSLEIELAKSNSSASSYATSLASALSSKSSSRSSSRGKADFDPLPPPPSAIELQRCNSDKIPVMIVPLRELEVNDQRMEKAKSMVDIMDSERNNNNNIKNGKVKKGKKKKDKKELKKTKKENKKSNAEIIV